MVSTIIKDSCLLASVPNAIGDVGSRMPRFSDQWVVDKVMFDYVNGGECTCCGFAHIFNPQGLEGMINAMSDLETDAAAKELNAAKASPWPSDMRDHIWSDRLLLRFRMKKEMKRYRSFLKEIVLIDSGRQICEDDVDVKDAIPILHKFCTNDLPAKKLREVFQMPRSELTEVLKSRYKICSAYAVLFCSVVEQLANFKVTKYPIDARSNSGADNEEVLFENELKYVKIGPGFTLNVVTKNPSDNCGDGGLSINDDVLLVFLNRVVSLAGPTLLARAGKVHRDDDDDDDDDVDRDNPVGSETENNVTSFRSDRRVARLLIARYWADSLIELYEKAKQNPQDPEE